VEVFRGVWRVLRDDGVLFVNLGDSYNAYNHNRGASPSISGNNGEKHPEVEHRGLASVKLKPKDLLGIPWRVALALQADGWYLRSDIIWAKPNPMPESVTDRPTKSHEYLFLLTKKPTYYYDAEAVREEAEYGYSPKSRMYDRIGDAASAAERTKGTTSGGQDGKGGGRNLRDVWTIPTKGYPGAHFATFPPALIEPCIKAGTSAEGCCPECGAPWVRVTEASQRQLQTTNNPGKQDEVTGWNRDKWPRTSKETTTTGWQPTCECNAGDPVPCTVLDPFMGSGTTAEVARANGCRCVGIELNSEYINLAAERLKQGRLF